VKTPSSFLKLSKPQRRGIIWTLVLFFLVHLGITYIPRNIENLNPALVLDSTAQQKVDAVVSRKPSISKDTIYPFNPNYISEFKAYQLGISLAAVYRIRSYRESGKYINSEKVLQQVAQLTEEEITRIRPYLKLPKPFLPNTKKPKKKRVKKELNAATPTDL
jgi:competence protein ComEA